MSKKTFWCVSQRYFDDGAVKVNGPYKVEADKKPESGEVENKMCDQYKDYFDTYDEAKAFAKECENA